MRFSIVTLSGGSEGARRRNACSAASARLGPVHAGAVDRVRSGARHLDLDRVGEIQRREDGAQRVHAVRAWSPDVEDQVELGEGALVEDVAVMSSSRMQARDSLASDGVGQARPVLRREALGPGIGGQPERGPAPPGPPPAGHRARPG